MPDMSPVLLDLDGSTEITASVVARGRENDTIKLVNKTKGLKRGSIS